MAGIRERNAEGGRITLPPREENDGASAASRINLSRLLNTAPTMASAFTAMNVTMATTLEVPPLEREIMVLAVLFLERGEYEIAQHREVARMMGIGEDKVQAIAEERYSDPLFNARERALLAFTRQSVRSVRIDDAVFDAVAAFYDDRQIVESLFVIGNYMMLLRISEAAELPVDSVAGANFWKNRLDGKEA
jgi:alkylhydroperoxidase family enzyme